MSHVVNDRELRRIKESVEYFGNDIRRSGETVWLDIQDAYDLYEDMGALIRECEQHREPEKETDDRDTTSDRMDNGDNSVQPDDCLSFTAPIGPPKELLIGKARNDDEV